MWWTSRKIGINKSKSHYSGWQVFGTFVNKKQVFWIAREIWYEEVKKSHYRRPARMDTTINPSTKPRCAPKMNSDT